MTRPLHITYNPQQECFVVTFFNGVQRNYASFNTLIGFLTDYYRKVKRGNK